MRRVAVLVASLLLFWFGANAAAAHADLTGFTLETGGSGDIVRLTFSEPVASLGTTVAVLDPNGNAVQADEALVDGAVVSVRLVPLTVAGDYHVNYRVLADDGHVINGSELFAVTAAGLANESSAYPALSASPETSAVTANDPTIAYWMTAFLMVGGILAAFIAWRARR